MTTITREPTLTPLPLVAPGTAVDFALKFSSYSAAAWLLLLPLQSLTICLAATLTIPLALLASKIAHERQLRGSVVVLLAALAGLLGCSAETVLGGPAFITQRLGSTTVLGLIGISTFSLWTFAVVFLLRTLSERRPALVVAEALLVVGAAVFYFYGHHDSQIDQPRQFSDWALAAGYDPRLVLRILGISTMGLVGLLLLRPRGLRQGLSALALFALLLLAGFYLSFYMFPDRVRPVNPNPAPGPGPSPTPSPSPVPNPNPEPDPTPSFDPHDWPKEAKPLAIATLHDDYAPPSDVFYFRAAAYSQYDGRKMITGRDPAQDPDVPREFATTKQTFPAPPIADKLQRTIPVTISLIEPHSAPVMMTNARSLEPLPNANPSTFVRTDKLEAQVLTAPFLTVEFLARGSGDPNWTAAERELYTQAPTDPRYKELAEQILAENPYPNLKNELRGSPVLKLLTLRRWMETNTTYWLQAQHHEAADPTASFLFGDRKGFCVHVAHAMVYLSRSLGLPTRLASGYLVSTSRTGKSSGILMTNADRHLWCELYVEGIGWVAIDPALEKSISPPPPKPDEALQEFYNEQNRPQFDPEPTRRSWVALVPPGIMAFVLAAVMSLYVVKVWRRYAPHWASTRVLYRVAYRALLDRLAEVGVSRQFGETHEEFARRVSEWAPEFAEPSRIHVREALTGEPVTDRLTWLGWIGQLDARIKRARRLDHRLIGYAHPFSWAAAK